MRSPLSRASATVRAGYAEETGPAMLIRPTSNERYSASEETVLINPATIAKSHGFHPGAMPREKMPACQR